MKKFLTGILLLVSISLFSQEVKGVSNAGGVEIMLGLGGGSHESVLMSAKGSYMADLNKIFKLGGGVGLYRYVEQGEPSNIGSNAFSLYMDLRTVCPLGTAVSLVGVMDGGIMFSGKKTGDDNVGAVISPQLGFRFKLSEKGLALNTRLQFQRITCNDDNVLGFSVGLSF